MTTAPANNNHTGWRERLAQTSTGGDGAVKLTTPTPAPKVYAARRHHRHAIT